MPTGLKKPTKENRMPKNEIQSLSPDALVHLADRMIVAIDAATPAAYGITTGQVGFLGAQRDALETANQAATNAKAAARAAIQDRDAKGASCTTVVATIANIVYANPAVTPAMIADLGLSPRSTTRTRVVPVTPLRLTAIPQPTGAILVEWDRNGNPSGVNFVVEAQVGGGDWRFVQDTTATRLLLSGYAPGMPVSFRVSASKNKTTSDPSSVATLYPASSVPALRLAA